MSTSSLPTILITGASGMLGRALHRLLLRETMTYNVIGTGFSRLTVNHYHEHFGSESKTVELLQLNLLDVDATKEFIERHRPDIIVHCAAQRFPDAFESNIEESIQLNVDSTRHLAKLCSESTSPSRPDYKPLLIYISTSYVFDGGIESKVYPPYMPESKANPINNYGKSKWDGERAIREVMNDATNNITGGRGIIVRVPLLYGEDCVKLDESPALEMLKVLLPSSTTTTAKNKIDDWALRFPTSCEDVARVLKLMIDHAFVDNQFAGTYHVASPHGITKFGLLQLQSRLLNISKDEVDDRAESVDDPKAANPSAAPRPQCTQLNCDDTWAALGKTFEFAPLEEAMGRAIQGFPKRFLDGT